MDYEEWRRVMRVNLDGVFFTFRAAARHMVERGKGGSLVAMASTAAIEGAARSSHYGASKGGVCAMVRALAVELARYKITRQLHPAGLDRDRDDGQRLRQREVRRQRDAAHSRAALGRRRRFRADCRLPGERRHAAIRRGATSSSMAAIPCSSPKHLGEIENDEDVRGLPGHCPDGRRRAGPGAAASRPRPAAPAKPAAAEDRYIGYYYPKPTSTETYEFAMQTIAGVERAQRIQFITVVSQGTIQSAYRVPYAVFVKGEKADR